MRHLIAFLAAAWLASAQAVPMASAGQMPDDPIPRQDRVPAALEFGKKQGDLSPSEVRFLTRNLAIVALEHFGGRNGPYATFDDGVAANAAKLKAADPSLKVLEYWGFSGRGHMTYHAYDDPEYVAHKSDWYTTAYGGKKPFLDITKPEVRRWWARQATLMVQRGKLDGLFIDGARNKPNDPWRDAKVELFRQLRADLDALPGPRKIVIINGNAPNFVGSGLGPYVDGVMIEFFDLKDRRNCGDACGDRSPELTLRDLETTYELTRAGKTVWLKAWPYPHSFLDPSWFKGVSYAQKIADMRAPLAWNLAAFLVAQNPGKTYLFYSWGYSLDSMEVVRNPDADPASWDVDQKWYAEMQHDYGSPLGPLEVHGYVLTRRYPGGIARVDLQSHTASLPQPVR